MPFTDNTLPLANMCLVQRWSEYSINVLEYEYDLNMHEYEYEYSENKCTRVRLLYNIHDYFRM